ncbi:MAG: ABC transporter substrate-binding protein [Candidatus Rokuibacteriota bacterium]|nr:MAG: ABC transporter substrate-binding protein [Candidatus Rokubacteria bacterium]
MGLTRRRFLRGVATTAAGAVLGGAAGRARAAPAPIKIGLLLPYSNVYAVLGESITDGLSLVFEQAGGTVAGRRVELIKEDDEVNPQVGLRKAKKLIESDGVDFLVGPVSSGVLAAIRDTVHQARQILIVANAGNDEISRDRCSRYIFRASFSNWQPNAPMGSWVAAHVAKEAYLVAPKYAAGFDMMRAFKETFVAAGGKVVGEDYTPFPVNEDFAPFLTKINQAAPKVVYAFFSGSQAVRFVRQYDEFGLRARSKLCGAGFLTESDVLPAQGQSALGIITGHFYSTLLDNPANKAFVRAFRAKYARTPDGFAVQGYDSAQVIAHGLTATGGDTRDKDRLLEALRGVEFDSPRGRFRFDPRTQNVIQPFIYVREVREVDGELANVVVDRIANVRDPGTGCTLPG